MTTTTPRPAAVLAVAGLALTGFLAAAPTAGADPLGDALAGAQAGSAQVVTDAQQAIDRALGRPAPDPTPVSPCPRTAAACVDLAGQRSWMQSNGRMDYGPVPVSTGRPGYETTPGSHRVVAKVRDEISHEFGGAPMPFSVYFTTNGMAFHEGDPGVLSHGCIHLLHPDAVAYFDRLQLGDEVFVY